MTLKPYGEMKVSGIEWLGDVPAHWEVVRLGALFREVAEDGFEGLPILSVSIHDGVSDKELNDEEMDRKVTRSDDVSKYVRVEPGDLVYNMMRAWQGGFGTVTVSGMVSPAYVVARPRFAFQTDYVELLLRTPNAIEQMRRLSKGVTDFRLRLYWDEFKGLKVVLPPRDEQAAINAYLSGETAKIDALVAEQEKLIALLAEKRRAVISQAVTKGLDPNAPMKDSGIKWLGDVPAHWDLSQLRHACSMIKDGTHLPPKRVDVGIPLLSVRNIQGGIFSKLDDDSLISETDYDELCRSLVPAAGDLVLAIVGATLGKVAVIPEDMGPFQVQRSVAILRPASNVFSGWMKYCFDSWWFQGLLWMSVGFSAQPGIYLGALAGIKIPAPRLEEQASIVAHLDRVTAQLDTLTLEAERGIALLKERRAALISAAVTGKIDVRGHVAAEEVAA
jgi:type I restriction enzyme S subunit